MPKERFKIIPAVYAIFVRDGKVLLMRRFNTGYHDGMYAVPAGHLEGNETLADALAREVKEELGVSVDKSDATLVHVVSRKQGDQERVDFFFRVAKWDGEPRIMEPNKCDDMQWFDLKNMPENTSPQMLGKIIASEMGSYSEHGWALK
jgi:ADP-ribose pyrophosphatase YjhB (NUDIX family)